MAEGGAADLETQRSDVAALLKTALRKGDTWYLVDSRWFKQWKKYVGFDSWDKYQMGDQNVYPGPIDNSGLLKGAHVLHVPEMQAFPSWWENESWGRCPLLGRGPPRMSSRNMISTGLLDPPKPA